MPGRHRITLLEIPFHLIQRGTHRQAGIIIDHVFHAFLNWLTVYAKNSHYSFHAYVRVMRHARMFFMPKTVNPVLVRTNRRGQCYV